MITNTFSPMNSQLIDMQHQLIYFVQMNTYNNKIKLNKQNKLMTTKSKSY